MTITQLNRKINGLPAKVSSIVNKSVSRHSNTIINMVNAQLEAGEDAEGKLKTSEHDPYGGYRSKSHIKNRQKHGKQTAYVDLNFTGERKANMYVKFNGTGIEVGSGVGGSPTHEWNGQDVLVHHWGKDIYNLNERNFDILIDLIFNDLHKELQKYFS